MKKLIILSGIMVAAFSAAGFTLPGTSIEYPFPGPPSETNTTAIYKDSSLFTGWADGYTQVSYGTDVDDMWKTPQKALGPATGGTYDIVCLGNGGQITMTFSKAIIDGDGFDFAVFENGVGDTFLELAWVEVSSDGIHFSRFPNFYAGTNSVGGYAGHDTTKIYGMASKYRAGYGTPFDLSELSETYNLAISGSNSVYTVEYKTALTNNFPYLDMNNVRYIRIIDIIGNGTSLEASGRPIYDPTPTYGSGGFDLEAVGAIHQVSDNRLSQTITFDDIPNQKLSTGSINLTAAADSGLPVSYAILEGNASVSSNRLTFSETGHITVQAQQSGNATYAAAVPVTQSFYVGEKIQHIYIEPIPNLIAGTNTWQVHAASDSGLPVSIEVLSGPTNTLINQANLVLTIGTQTGPVELRAWQNGNEEYAPAEEIRTGFSIVAPGSSYAPETFSQWCSTNGLPTDISADDDGDGAKNFQEYLMGTDPLDDSDFPRLTSTLGENCYGESVLNLVYTLSRQAYGRAQMQHATGLTGSAWSNAIPEIVSTENITQNETACVQITVQLPADSTTGFFRLLLQENE